jgi:hypothetical protein
MPTAAPLFTRDKWPALAGALGSLLVAGLLFARWGIHGRLSRDEAIYTYGGQQLAHGVAPYASIFDPKTPLATFVAGLAAGVARLFGRNDIYAIRLMYYLVSLATVGAVFLVARRLWRSVPAAVVAAVVFACFTQFAADALSGPDAKTPGVLAVVLSLWLALRRQWLLAAAAGSVGFLCWQPFLGFCGAIVVTAFFCSARDERWMAAARGVIGTVVPFAVVCIYFAAVGALGKFIDAAFVFPFAGVHRAPMTVGSRIHLIGSVIWKGYGVSGVLLAIGCVTLLTITVVHIVRASEGWRRGWRDPLLTLVILSLVLQIGYALSDFQGAPDVFPFLPFGALGLGGLAACVMTIAGRASFPRASLAAAAVSVVAVLVLGLMSWVWFGQGAKSDPGALRAELANTCALERIVATGGKVEALGDPTPLVLMHQRSFDRFIYLGSGVDHWKISKTPHGFHAWTAQIRQAAPTAVVIRAWDSVTTKVRMVAWLHSQGYRGHRIGNWLTYLTPEGVAAAKSRGVVLTPTALPYATGPGGRELPPAPCH